MPYTFVHKDSTVFESSIESNSIQSNDDNATTEKQSSIESNSIKSNDDNAKTGKQLESKDEQQNQSILAEFIRLNNIIFDLRNDVKNLKIELSNLKLQLDDFKSLTLYYIQKDVKNFYDKDGVCFSEQFNHLKLNWQIRIESKIVKIPNLVGKRCLGFYLYVKNEADGTNVNWQCKTNFVLKLKNQNKLNNLSKTYEHTFSGRKDPWYGCESFITVDDLFDLNKGYIRNNTINLEICLNADKVIRDNYL